MFLECRVMREMLQKYGGPIGPKCVKTLVSHVLALLAFHTKKTRAQRLKTSV